MATATAAVAMAMSGVWRGPLTFPPGEGQGSVVPGEHARPREAVGPGRLGACC